MMLVNRVPLASALCLQTHVFYELRTQHRIEVIDLKHMLHLGRYHHVVININSVLALQLCCQPAFSPIHCSI